MKNQTLRIMQISIVMLVIFMACSEVSEVKKKTDQVPVSIENWREAVQSLLPAGEIVVVESGESIQSAINDAEDGDMIFIEPGTYSEQVKLQNPGVRLYGIKGEDGIGVTLPNAGLTFESVEGFAQIQSITDPSASADNGKRKKGFCRIVSMEREELMENIVHYSFVLKVGEGEFDVVKLHRVVRERRKYMPSHTIGDVFMIHGASQNFTDIFLEAGSTDKSVLTSSPVYMAAMNVDVWGIDLGWTRIPQDVGDQSFMADWGVTRDADHTRKALSVARLIRLLSGSGYRGMNVLGFSYGAFVAYAAAGTETQEHRVRRDIKGLMIMDQTFKYAEEDEAFRQNSCEEAEARKGAIAAGVYSDTQGANISAIMQLARTDPDGPSPIPDFAPLNFTNIQVAKFLAANTYVTGASAPFWHFLAGDGTAPDDLAPDLRFTQLNRWTAFDLPPYMPMQTRVDISTCLCDEDDTEIDDNFEDIAVPLYYLGAGGGTGTQGLYGTTLIASSDVSSDIVSVDAQRFRDYGHADLWMADNAPDLVWSKLFAWVADHRR